LSNATSCLNFASVVGAGIGPRARNVHPRGNRSAARQTEKIPANPPVTAKTKLSVITDLMHE
jgi:hypothetical protein